MESGKEQDAEVPALKQETREAAEGRPGRWGKMGEARVSGWAAPRVS